MRDILITALVFVSAGYALSRPQIGIYAWSVLSYMNPHRFTWGFAYTMPFAQIIAIVTLIGILLWKEPKRIPMNRLTVLWAMFLGWMAITTLFALQPDVSTPQLIKVLKIQLVTVLTILVIKNRKDLNILVWVIALSIGFFGIKGGVFTIQTLGAHRVWGPPGSFIEDNNELALAQLMVLPLFYYLSTLLKARWQKLAIMACMLLMVASVFGSQSRGAFLAIGATSFYLWLKTSNKIITGFLIALVLATAVTLMPQSWHDRMATIQNYEEDGSAMGRINAWAMTINLASDRITGGGYSMWSPAVYRMYSENRNTWNESKAAHSIYFSILGEHGWVGLVLFVSILFAAWSTSRQILRKCKPFPELTWLANLTRMIQVSLIAYVTGGAFLSLAYFDLPWHLISILVIGRSIVDEKETTADSLIRVGPDSNRGTVLGVASRAR